VAHAEASARTVEAAAAAAAAELGLRPDQVDVEVLEDPVPSTFGYIGSPARVRVSSRSADTAGADTAGTPGVPSLTPSGPEQAQTPDSLNPIDHQVASASDATASPAPASSSSSGLPTPGLADAYDPLPPQRSDASGVRVAERTDQSGTQASTGSSPSRTRKRAGVAPSGARVAPASPDQAASDAVTTDPASLASTATGVDSDPASQGMPAPSVETQSSSPGETEPAVEQAATTGAAPASATPRREQRNDPVDPEMVEVDTERAGDFLEGLLDALDVDGDITTWVDSVGGHVDLEGSDLDVLVGSNGETLDALQELTRLAVLRQSKRRARLLLDINGFRAQQRERLVSIVKSTVEQVIRTGEDHEMRPMSPAERKVVHDAVAAIEGAHTESLGEEPNRRVVIRPS
jgi:spoIIIJ-associated protein